jgi:putative membrane protein
MKFGAIIGGIFGLGLAAWLIESYGLSHILALLNTAGWLGILAVIAFHPLQMWFSALGWQAIAGPTDPPLRLRTYLSLRWIRESVNNILPLAQIGGEFVASRLLYRRGLNLAPAIAGTVADLSMEMASQIAFTLLGLLLLASMGKSSSTAYIISGVVTATLLLAVFFGALWFGLIGMLERGLIKLGQSIGWAATANVEGLHDGLVRCYRSPRRVMAAALWHMISWLLGALEVCIALHFLGHDVDLRTGLIIESLGQAFKAAGFAVPGALGIQEGGYIVVCRIAGLSPDVAIALSLLKRLRELALGLPGLVLWQVEEKRVRNPTASLSGAAQ